ncbi:MAG: glycosyltransferase family 39 protein [Deltaproteobacteria bacterium]|nr:glycosyltransferase family 39 protein [Deltaproteobacteria bacterium]
MRGRRPRDLLFVVLVAAAALLPFLGQTHEVSSHEVRHAEIGREMAESGDFLVPRLLGVPYRDKPPVLSAAIAALDRWNGEPTMTLARLPSAIAAIAGAALLYEIGRTLADPSTALLAALGVLATQSYQDMARTARPDMIFTLALLAAAWASIAALRSPGARAAAGFAAAGAACAVASLLKGPLAWGFCAVFPGAAWLCERRLRRPGPRDAAAFAAGFALAAVAWIAPLLASGHGAYLWSFLTQPDLTTWQAADSFRRIHWPWLYGFVGFLPLALLLPLAVGDARRRGIRPAAAIALAMLVILSLIPKKRMHYPLPVQPFLALAVAEAVMQAADRRWRRAAALLIALSLLAGPLYFGAVAPWRHPGGDEEQAAARRILDRAPPGAAIVCWGDMAERLAFVGRRGDVVRIDDPAGLVREARRRGGGTLAVLPASLEIDAAPELRALARVSAGEQRWRIYRVDSAGG